MKSVIHRLLLIAAGALLWTSCKVLESPDMGITGDEGLLYPYVENQKVGFMDENLVQRISPQFQIRENGSWPYSFSEGLAVVYDSGRAGYINREGTLAIRPRFEEAKSFREGLALVKSDGKYGFIDDSGDYTIPPQFYRARSFKNGRAAVQKEENGRWGYIDAGGTFVIEPQFSNARNFSDNRALVQTPDHREWGYIDRSGDFVIDPQYREAKSFSNSLADRKSTRLNSSHVAISYAVFCLKKKKQRKRA